MKEGRHDAAAISRECGKFFGSAPRRNLQTGIVQLSEGRLEAVEPLFLGLFQQMPTDHVLGMLGALRLQ